VRASPIATFTTPQDVCLNGGPVELNTGVATGGTAVYTGPGVTFAGGVYTFNPLATGVVVGANNNVTYTVTSPATCDSALVRQVKVLAPPVVNIFTTVGNKCRINDIVFHNTTTNGDGTIVKWIYNWGDGSLPQAMTTGADVTHQYTTAGVKTATLTLETGFGCRNIPFPLTFTVNPLPVPSYTPSPSACLPSANIVFTNTTAQPLTDYIFNWSFELPSTTAANTSTSASPTHTYTTQGPYNTHLIATIIATGCKDSTVIIPIGASIIHPAPVLRFDNIPDVCLNNGIVSFFNFASETSGLPPGQGIFSGPGIISANGDFNPLLVGAGTYDITYKWTSTFGCPTTIIQQVKVLAAPVVDTFTTLGNRCEQNGIVFHNATTQGAGSIVTWLYNWDDGMTQTASNGNDITHFYATAGTYHPTVYVITINGCKSLVKPLTVIVNALPKPDFFFTPVACLPQAKIDFTNNTPPQSTGSLAYQWVFDDVPATIKTTVNTDFTYTTLGSHPVELIATNTTTFCKSSKIKDIINSLHPAPTASFNFNKLSICIGDNVKVLDGPSNPADGTITNWKWNYGDNAALFIGQTQAPHTYAAAGTYDVKLIVTNNFGCVDDTIKSFTVHPFPVVNAGRDSVILQGGNLVLTATASGNDLIYSWIGNPAPINLSSTTVLNPLASPVEDIYYTLKVTARGGCADTNGVFIKVLKYPIIPNTFTPNNDGVHDTWVIKYLESYPDNRVQVFTRAGQLVFESKRYLKPWDGTVNGKSLPFDTYYYIIEPGTGRAPLTGYVTLVK
jgi:gliding motility-associated-like protein